MQGEVCAECGVGIALRDRAPCESDAVGGCDVGGHGARDAAVETA